MRGLVQSRRSQNCRRASIALTAARRARHYRSGPDRLLRIATSPRWARAHLAPALLEALGHFPQRTAGFRIMGQLAYHYRESPLSAHEVRLHQLAQDPGFHLVVCGIGRPEDLPPVPRGVSNQ